MSGRRSTFIAVEVEPIPDIDGDEWYAWCAERGFYGLNGGRRAWISDLNTYLRNDDYLVYYQGMLVATAHSSELKLEPGGKAMWEEAL